MPSTKGLGPKNQFWVNLAQKTNQAITPEPYLQLYKYSFYPNPEENLMNT